MVSLQHFVNETALYAFARNQFTQFVKNIGYGRNMTNIVPVFNFIIKVIERILFQYALVKVVSSCHARAPIIVSRKDDKGATLGAKTATST